MQRRHQPRAAGAENENVGFALVRHRGVAIKPVSLSDPRLAAKNPREQCTHLLKHTHPFQSLNGSRRRNTARTYVATIAEGVTTERATFSANYLQSLFLRGVARIGN